MTLPAQVSHGDSLRDTLTTVAEEVESSKTGFRVGLLLLLDSVTAQCESRVYCCCWTHRKPCYDPVQVLLCPLDSHAVQLAEEVAQLAKS